MPRVRKPRVVCSVVSSSPVATVPIVLSCSSVPSPSWSAWNSVYSDTRGAPKSCPNWK